MPQSERPQRGMSALLTPRSAPVMVGLWKNVPVTLPTTEELRISVALGQPAGYSAGGAGGAGGEGLGEGGLGGVGGGGLGGAGGEGGLGGAGGGCGGCASVATAHSAGLVERSSP